MSQAVTGPAPFDFRVFVALVLSDVSFLVRTVRRCDPEGGYQHLLIRVDFLDGSYDRTFPVWLRALPDFDREPMVEVTFEEPTTTPPGAPRILVSAHPPVVARLIAGGPLPRRV